MRYDRIGARYTDTRRPDPRLQQCLMDALGDAASVVNVGAGSGSYEPTDRHVIAVEPSAIMLAQRPAESAPVVQGVAEALPFAQDAFDVAMAVLTVHHWADRDRGYRELCRVAPRRMVLTYDPVFHHENVWIVRDYVPEIGELDRQRNFSIEEVVRGLGATRVVAVPVPWDCTDGFLGAYWRRPRALFDPHVRRGTSGLSLLEHDVVERGLTQLRADLRSGRWNERNGSLLDADELDIGLRLVISD